MRLPETLGPPLSADNARKTRRPSIFLRRIIGVMRVTKGIASGLLQQSLLGATGNVGGHILLLLVQSPLWRGAVTNGVAR